MDRLFFMAATLACFVSAAGYMVSLWKKRVFPARISAWVLLASVVFHTASFTLRATAAGRMGEVGLNPAVNLGEALSFLALILNALYLLIQWKSKVKILGAFVTPVSLLLMIGASAGYGLGPDMALSPGLRGGLVAAHVIFSIAGEALFAIAGLAGLVYLIQSGFLKHPRKNRALAGFSRLLPSLGDLDRINHYCLLSGFPLLTIGVIAGSVWAGVVWGSHWDWDPKQVWTLIAWVSYAVLLHQRLAIGWNGRKAAFWTVAATIIMTFLLIGVNAFHVTAHRFI